MPHFVFIIDGRLNSKTVDLPSVAAAKCEALHHASKVVCDEPEQFWNTREFQMIVTDERGLALFMLTISGTESPAISPVPRVSA